MITTIEEFLSAESGSVTTDWVVLVASLIMLSFLVMASVSGGTTVAADNLGRVISERDAG